VGSDGKGVTIPSQVTYIRYYKDILKYGQVPKPLKAPKGKKGRKGGKAEVEDADPAENLVPIVLKSVMIRVSQYAQARKVASKNQAEVFVEVVSNSFTPEKPEPEMILSRDKCKRVFVEDVNDVGGKKKGKKGSKGSKGEAGFAEIPLNLTVAGDIRISLFDSKHKNKGQKEIGHLYFNTYFVEDNRIYLPKPRLDVIWNDKKEKNFTPEFAVKLVFEGAAPGGNQLRKQRARVDPATLPPASKEEVQQLDERVSALLHEAEERYEDVQELEDEVMMMERAAKESKKGKKGSSSRGVDKAEKGGKTAAKADAKGEKDSKSGKKSSSSSSGKGEKTEKTEKSEKSEKSEKKGSSSKSGKSRPAKQDDTKAKGSSKKDEKKPARKPKKKEPTPPPSSSEEESSAESSEESSISDSSSSSAAGSDSSSDDGSSEGESD
jgi:C2 domain of PTEN tumour-suppressor protein